MISNKKPRWRRLRKWGNQIVIPLHSIDCKDMKLTAEDEVDISDITKKRGVQK